MLIRRVAVGFVVVVSAGLARAQTVDVTGQWTGAVTGSVSCTGGGSAAETVNINLNLQQSGSNVTGSGSAVSPHDPCTTGSPIDTAPITSVSATISGSTIDGTVTISPPGSGSQTTIIHAVVSGSTMQFTILISSTQTAQGTLTKQVAPSVDVTGSWGGTFSGTEHCDTGTVSWSSPVVLTVSQQGASVSGGLVFSALANTSSQCVIVGTEQAVLPVVGSVSDSTLNGIVTDPEGGTTAFTASISGSTMTFTVSGVTAGSAVLTRGATTVDMHLTGTYSGGFTSTIIPCVGTPAQQPPLTFSGTFTGSLTQTGSLIIGIITVSGDKSDNQNGTTCSVVNKPPNNVTFTAQISGNMITGGAVQQGKKPNPITGTITGSTISFQGAGHKSGESFSGVITKSGAAAAPPQILSFIATPTTIRTGQSSTLSWTTSSATNVTIDSGVGNEPASGTTTVSPAAKTTYTLTASQGTQTTTATVTVDVLTAPIVNVTTIPATMLELAGSGSATTFYALTNSGSASTSVTLTQNGNFFTQSPATFTLAAGATQLVSITASAQPQGAYEGSSLVSGDGVPSGLQVLVKLVATPAPSGPVTADPTANRVDVAAAGGASPSGSVSFKNNGTAQLVGVLNSDSPWIIPQSGSVTINPGQTGTFTFTIDRTKRPDSASPVGSAEGVLTLSFLSGSASSFAAKPQDNTTTIPSVTLVKIVDTVQPAVTSAGIPALGTSEVALFVAGVGHVIGTGGAQFVSDVSILNPQGGKSVDDLKMYYTSTTASSSSAASLPSVPGEVSVAVADVVKNVFSGTNERGSLQLRSKDADKITASAAVLTTNNPTGTYGNSIPVFRSDRAIASGEALVLTGLRKDNTTHTNLYIQEAAGAPASVQTDFLAADGSTVSSRTDAIDVFKLLALDNVVPVNAVAALITNKSTAGGKIAAYATPVDEASGDTWAIADWSKQYGYSGSEVAIVPIAGSVHGANGTFYRTDLSITNRGTDPAAFTLQYTSRVGTIAQKQLSLTSKQTLTVSDVIGLFSDLTPLPPGISGDTLGFLTLTPTNGSIAVSSRTFTTAGSKPATFGSGVPALAASSALHAGGTRAIAGLADAARTTVIAGKPSTYRTNFALVETTGQPVTVRVTFRFSFPAGQKVQGVGAASRDYSLNGNEFLLLNSIAGEILGPPRLQYGDLTNVEADFQVIDGSGAVMLFTSSVDNASGDSILRVE